MYAPVLLHPIKFPKDFFNQLCLHHNYIIWHCISFIIHVQNIPR